MVRNARLTNWLIIAGLLWGCALVVPAQQQASPPQAPAQRAPQRANTAPPMPNATPTPSPRTQLLSKAGLQFELPAKWQLTRNALNDWELRSPEGGLSVTMVETTAEHLDEEMARLLQGYVKDFARFNDEAFQAGTFKGMNHRMRTGRVKNLLNQATVEWSLDIISADCPLIIFSQVHGAVKENHREAYIQLLDSLRRR